MSKCYSLIFINHQQSPNIYLYIILFICKIKLQWIQIAFNTLEIIHTEQWFSNYMEYHKMNTVMSDTIINKGNVPQLFKTVIWGVSS